MKYSQEEINNLLMSNLTIQIFDRSIILYKIEAKTNEVSEIVHLTLEQAKNLFKALGKQIVNLKCQLKESKCSNCSCGLSVCKTNYYDELE